MVNPDNPSLFQRIDSFLHRLQLLCSLGRNLLIVHRISVGLELACQAKSDLLCSVLLMHVRVTLSAQTKKRGLTGSLLLQAALSIGWKTAVTSNTCLVWILGVYTGNVIIMGEVSD